MMGLGKTLETLMLVLAHPAPSDWAVADLDGRSRASDVDPVPIKTTLIVMPANLLTQWQEELQLHVNPGALTWCALLPWEILLKILLVVHLQMRFDSADFLLDM